MSNYAFQLTYAPGKHQPKLEFQLHFLQSQEDSEGESDVVVLSDESNEDCPLVELLDEIINLRDQVHV